MWGSGRSAIVTCSLRHRALAVSGCVNLTGAGLETAAYHLRLHSLRADDLAGAGDGVAAVVANMPLSSAATDPDGCAASACSLASGCAATLALAGVLGASFVRKLLSLLAVPGGRHLRM